MEMDYDGVYAAISYWFTGSVKHLCRRDCILFICSLKRTEFKPHHINNVTLTLLISYRSYSCFCCKLIIFLVFCHVKM